MVIRRGFGVMVAWVFAQCVWAADAQVEAPAKPAFPLHVSGDVANSVGIGSFVSGYRRQPSFGTSLTMIGSYDVPEFIKGFPLALALRGDLTMDWLPSYTTSDRERPVQVRVEDIIIKLTSPKVFNDKQYGFFFTPALTLITPASVTSQAQNRILGFSLQNTFGWQNYGFSVGYTPVGSIWTFSSEAITLDCGVSTPDVINPNNPDFGVEQYMWQLVAASTEQRLPDGRCVITGRQAMASVKNVIEAGWSYKNHSIGASLTWVMGFLRPLENNPELHSLYASTSNMVESSKGQISYSYQIPVGFDLVVEGGVLSYQAAYDEKGRVRFPFFDFLSPANNFTQFYIDISAGV